MLGSGLVLSLGLCRIASPTLDTAFGSRASLPTKRLMGVHLTTQEGVLMNIRRS